MPETTRRQLLYAAMVAPFVALLRPKTVWTEWQPLTGAVCSIRADGQFDTRTGRHEDA